MQNCIWQLHVAVPKLAVLKNQHIIQQIPTGNDEFGMPSRCHINCHSCRPETSHTPPKPWENCFLCSNWPFASQIIRKFTWCFQATFAQVHLETYQVSAFQDVYISQSSLLFTRGKRNDFWMILLIEEILHHLIWYLSHYLQGSIHPRWFSRGISQPSTSRLTLKGGI